MLENYLSKLEKQGVKVYTRRPVSTFEDNYLDVWQKMSKDSQAYFALNKKNPLIREFLNESSSNKDFIKLIENTLPYQEIFRLMCDGKESIITWNDENHEAINLIKKIITSLKENNVDQLIIIGLVQKFLRNSEFSLTRDQIIEMI